MRTTRRVRQDRCELVHMRGRGGQAGGCEGGSEGGGGKMDVTTHRFHIGAAFPFHAPLECGLDVVFGHVAGFCLTDGGGQTDVRHVPLGLPGGFTQFHRQLGEENGPLGWTDGVRERDEDVEMYWPTRHAFNLLPSLEPFARFIFAHFECPAIIIMSRTLVLVLV